MADEDLRQHVPGGKIKYVKWLKREIKKGYRKEDLVPTIEFFHNNQDKFEERDLFKWDGKDLENHIKEKNLTSKRASKQEVNAVKIFENEEFLVVRPMDVTAAAKYGMGSKWCITMEDTNYFQSYRDNGYVFYMCIDKTADNQHKWGKLCVTVKKGVDNTIEVIEYWNSEDKKVSASRMTKRWRNFFSQEISDDGD